MISVECVEESWINKEALLKLYYYMFLTRKYEEVLSSYFSKSGLPEKPISSVGQEAVAVGATFCLRKDDYVLPSLRTRGAFLVKGMTLKEHLMELYRKKDSLSKGMWTSHHLGNINLGIILGSGVVGSSLPVAAGTALSSKIRKTDQVTLAFFGDGASSTETFHSTLNFSAVLDLPIIFVCENNMYALSTPLSKQVKNPDIVDRAIGVGIEGDMVDGQDVIEVVHSVNRAIHRARVGKGPTLIECKTYHFRGHSESHHPDDGRPKEELEHWRSRCPLKIYTNYLLQNNFQMSELSKIEKKAKEEIREAFEFVMNCPDAAGEDILESNVYA